MPADKYGKKLYAAGTVKAEKAAMANRDPARKKAAELITAREGSTNPGGGRAPVKMPAKAPALKAPKQQVISTTKMFKPSPMTKKR